ncbi:Palmitoyltransferase PFA5 [Ceratocystis fimbriata CBS 114723]|uniref:Palmitoyltransferase n=1 Tax=Ceratocystis fimbriata CBS 114723 TaxID=1035309 RepID=A0A2C5X157_9PEZI|nr:Palmitoyltransferase PFA5 [Ceratocystis fimbriata CBS 114723]
MKPESDNSLSRARCQAKWMTRLVPLVIAGLVGFGIYAAVFHNCINYIIRKRHKNAPAIVLLVLLFLFLFLAACCYLRTFYIVKTNPAIVPLLAARDDENDPSAVQTEKKPRVLCRSNGRLHPPTAAVEVEHREDENEQRFAEPEWFYTKSVFVCESDGLPRWCSECRQRKPDRAHHSSDLGRCVYKMDHFCPWVGGVVSETSFKFFTQFNIYCAAFCVSVLSCNAYGVALRLDRNEGSDAVSIACIAVSGFFGIFCFLMACTSLRYVLMNQTNIDMMKRGMSSHLAVLIDPSKFPTPGPGDNPELSPKYRTKTYPLDVARDLFPMAIQSAEPPNGPNRGTRTFAILRAEPRENPWDLGWKRNWQQVMGYSILDWVLPVKMSPCALHNNPDSEYPVGPLVEELRRRYQLPSAEMDSTETWLSTDGAEGTTPTYRSASTSASQPVSQSGGLSSHSSATRPENGLAI